MKPEDSDTQNNNNNKKKKNFLLLWLCCFQNQGQILPTILL